MSDPLISTDALQPAEAPVIEAVKDTVPAGIPDVHLLPVQGLFGIHDPAPQEKDMLNYVWKQASDGAVGIPDALYKIRQIENRLTPARMGESRLSKIYQYFKLQAQAKEVEAQLEAL